MEEHAIPVGHLVLPVLLPFAQGVFLEEAVCADNQHGGGGFEAHAALDADDGVAHVHVASDAIGRTDFFNLLDGLDGVVEAFAVHGLQFTLLEGEAQLLGAFLGAMLQVGTLW